jgi:hypothetical protein
VSPTETLHLLRDVFNAIEKEGVYRAGKWPGFPHIQYCRFCHYAQNVQHDELCIVPRLYRAIDEAKADGGTEHG